jgi:hypothetical protein
LVKCASSRASGMPCFFIRLPTPIFAIRIRESWERFLAIPVPQPFFYFPGRDFFAIRLD